MYLAYLLAAVSGGPMQPSTKWVVEFADSACILSRSYGQGDQQIDIHFKAALIGRGYEISVVTHEDEPHVTKFDRGWIERADGTRAGPLRVQSYSTVSKKRMSRILVDPEIYVVGLEGERLILHLDKKRRLDLAITDFSKALPIVEQCSLSLRKAHGIDEQLFQRIAKPPKRLRSLTGNTFNSVYPATALARGHQGIVGALFWVETDGKVTECKVIESSHRPALDDRTCDLIVDLLYSPALDKAGHPIRVPLYQRMSWMIGF